MNVHFDCIVSNLKMISNMSTLPPGKMYVDAHECQLTCGKSEVLLFYIFAVLQFLVFPFSERFRIELSLFGES